MMEMQRELENWDTLQMLFHLAEETPPEEREQVLAQRCADPELVKRALRLLSGADDLDQSRPSPAKTSVATRVGPYILANLLGSGGIGSVYLVERMVGGAPQRFALKMLAPHAAGPSFIDRFHREQHILGSLNHANITRFVDAGQTETGQQYLVMEYVDGRHLDDYCDQAKLSIAERLKLFLTICDAVFYAHRNLIVHLDLKPSNILVGQDGVPKLLDFGTSKLIEPDSQLTTTVMATPAYASPEQLRNEPVTTACDVYALGAILFELLSGRRPYANSSVAKMMERAVADQQSEDVLAAVTAEAAEQRGLSEARLRQQLSGDLQTVVAKCLMPRPAERYVSVDALAQDVQRYLDGEPVLARRQTALYRLGKFVRRHKAGVIAGVAASGLLIGSLSYAAWRQQQALREARRAEQMQTFMHQLFRLANSSYTGKPAVTVPEFLQLGVKMLPDYIRNPEDLLQAKIALAESTYDNGDLDDARAIFNQTAATARTLNNADAEAESDAFAGHIAFSQGKYDDGLRLTAEALRISRQPGVSAIVRVRAADYFAWNREDIGMYSDEDVALLRNAAEQARSNDLPLHEKADAIHELANTLLYRGHLDEVQPLEDEALSLLKQDPASVCDRSEIYGEMAEVKQLKQDYESSLPLWQSAYSGYSTCSGADGREAISMLAYEARNLVYMGRGQEAVQLLEQARPYWEKLPDRYGRWAAFPTILAYADNATGRYQDAEELISAVAGRLEKGQLVWHFGFLEYVWAGSLAGQNKYAEAWTHAERSAKDWSIIPSFMNWNPEDYRRVADLDRLEAEIRTHLNPAPGPLPEPHPQGN
jgi:tetratricopeptide (TPR) repeat protein/predicted Ser/Thr protein kinase